MENTEFLRGARRYLLRIFFLKFLQINICGQRKKIFRLKFLPASV